MVSGWLIDSFQNSKLQQYIVALTLSLARNKLEIACVHPTRSGTTILIDHLFCQTDTSDFCELQW